MSARTLTNNHIELMLSRDENTLLAQSLTNAATGFNWVAPGTPISPFLSSAGHRFSGSVPVEDWTLTGGKREKGVAGSEVLVTIWSQPDGLTLEWAMTGFSDLSVIEFTALLRNEGKETLPGLTGIGPLAIQLQTGSYRAHWVTRPDYRKQERGIGAAFTLKGGGWNSPDSAGWLAIEREDVPEILFLGIERESGWGIQVEKNELGYLLTCALEPFSRRLPPGTSIAAPRVFLGVAHGTIDDALRASHDYLRQHVIPLKPADFPWVTYDIWGTEAEGVEEALLAEIPFAADLGVDLFYVDASWYEGSCKNGSGDWFTGVGNWRREDRIKFPLGLAHLSRHVHRAGMKFGLWFCPLMCDSSLVGDTIAADWVARKDGRDISLDLGNGWAPITQLCLGNPEVVAYLKAALSEAVERYDLDWLKWDDSGLPGPVCNRPDHGHAAADGALAALTGKYAIWERLHQQYPDLSLENCGYPSRLDYGLARYARAHWLSDDTSNARHCRQSQIHGSYVFPAAFNTAWVVKSEELSETDDAVLDSIVRSRMIGLFGMGTLTGTLPERVSLYPRSAREALKRCIAQYKRYRHLLSEDVYHLLPPSTDAGVWDAIQFCTRDGSEAVVIVFRDTSPQVEFKLALRGLSIEANYTVTSMNTNRSEIHSAATLMADGLKVRLPTPDTSEIYLLKTHSM